MTIDELIDLARRVEAAEEKGNGWWVVNACALAGGVLELLTPEKPCGWSSDGVVSDAGDGYVRVYALRDLRADEAQWAAVEILKAAEAARGKEQSK